MRWQIFGQEKWLYSRLKKNLCWMTNFSVQIKDMFWNLWNVMKAPICTTKIRKVYSDTVSISAKRFIFGTKNLFTKLWRSCGKMNQYCTDHSEMKGNRQPCRCIPYHMGQTKNVSTPTLSIKTIPEKRYTGTWPDQCQILLMEWSKFEHIHINNIVSHTSCLSLLSAKLPKNSKYTIYNA